MNVLKRLDRFYKKYKGEKGVIGYSELGEKIPYFKVYKTNYPIIVAQYCIHAREYITAELCLKTIKYQVKNGKIGTIYFLPCTNPDGVKICLNGNRLYKANANMVDLNVNFDARWAMGDKNVKTPSSENYIGKFPFSEKESRALRDFTLKVKPDSTLSFHSKGEVIYYGFDGSNNIKRDKNIAKRLSKVNGYQVERSVGSVGGYKDWCVEKLDIPSFTIEVGSDSLSHPIKRKYLGKIYKRNKNLINALTEILCVK